MGAYFGPLQGGAYVSQGVAAAIGWLAEQGLTGIGQSSWGPTGFAFVPSEAEGQRLLDARQRASQRIVASLRAGEGAQRASHHRDALSLCANS